LRRRPETAVGYQPANETAGNADSQHRRDSQMRALSFILAFAFLLVGPSLAGSSDNSLPGIGTFAYNGSPISSPPEAMVVAAR
jgi:hypothetical protein